MCVCMGVGCMCGGLRLVLGEVPWLLLTILFEAGFLT